MFEAFLAKSCMHCKVLRKPVARRVPLDKSEGSVKGIDILGGA